MTTSSTPLRILSLDGGGIRGISSLLILEKIMEQIRDTRRLENVPRPCEVFDLIGGTSTGGIIAIMLGRLGMTVDECIRAYRDVARAAFTPKRTTIFPASPAGAFSAKALEAAIKHTIREYCVDPECASQRKRGGSTAEACPHSEMEFRNSSCTKTVVLAITKDNVDARPTLFMTYDMSADFHGCTIWQVARATSAATTFFKPIRIGRDNIEFVDAAFGYNNPCEVLIEEAQRLYPGPRELRVLSIGTGLGDVVEIGKTRLSIINALKKMTTSSKNVAARLDRRYGGGDRYCRFNVDLGLQDVILSDWEKASTISAHTRNYLSDNQRAVKKFVDEFVKTIHDDRETSQITNRSEPQNVETLARELQSTTLGFPPEEATVLSEPGTAPNKPLAGHQHHILPPKNQGFVGRDEILNTLKIKFFVQACRKVAVAGLGGVGKTQVALKFAYWVKENKPDYSIFWVPALSDATFEQAYVEIATILAIRKGSDDEDTGESVKRHLSSKAAGPWLLIVDNVDDMDLLVGGSAATGGISRYIPDSESGLVLFTTRFGDVASRAADRDIVELDQMDSNEAKNMLEKSLRRKELMGGESTVEELLDELTYLPLAIMQAAAYLDRNQISISEYLGLLRGTEKDMVDVMSRGFHDNTRYSVSQNAVATTWLVSFDQIYKTDAAAATLLSFMSQIEPKAIPESILPTLESKERKVHAIGTLCGYAFVSRRDGKLLDMHRLVHVATRVWIEKHDRAKETENVAIQHFANIFPLAYKKNRELWREYLPHAICVLGRSKECGLEERTLLMYRVGRCLHKDRRFKEAIPLFQHVVAIQKTLAEDDQFRLRSEHELASAYLDDRRVKEAIPLLEHVVAIQKTLAVDNHSRLTIEQSLARAYIDDKRAKEAIPLLKHVIAIKSMTLASDDHSRLTAEHELSRAYISDQRFKEAIPLLEHVVACKSKSLAEDEQSRLKSEQALGRAYLDDRRAKEAIPLFERVMAIKSRTLAEDDRSRLTTEHELARAYLNDRRAKEAIPLLEHVVAIKSRTLAVDDHSRRKSEHELARAYHDDRRG